MCHHSEENEVIVSMDFDKQRQELDMNDFALKVWNVNILYLFLNWQSAINHI